MEEQDFPAAIELIQYEAVGPDVQQAPITTMATAKSSYVDIEETDPRQHENSSFMPSQKEASRIHLIAVDEQALLHPPRQRLTGWRFGALCSAIAVTTVAVINIAFAIWLSRAHPSDSGFKGAIFIDRCEAIDSDSLIAHLIINVLGAVLLASSSYCMQCLSAPTSHETRVAHSKGRWLDVGILSVNNLRRISKKRMVLWWVIAATTVPIHWL